MSAHASAPHLLVLDDRDLHVLGALYSLGIMAALATKFGAGDSAHVRSFEEARRVTMAMLEMEPFATTYQSVRDKILELASEDAER